MRMTSPAFVEGEALPRRFMEEGGNVSPPLSFSGVPARAKELALIVEDPEAPKAGRFVHWVMYKIPPEVTGVPEGVPRGREEVPRLGAVQGENDLGPGSLGYRGPSLKRRNGNGNGRGGQGGQASAAGASEGHRYRFRLFALDAELDLAPGVKAEALERAMQGHVLAETELLARTS